MQPLYKRYENEEPAGVYSRGYCGYVFFEPTGDDRGACDYVVCYEYASDLSPRGYVRKEYRRHTVKYTTGGREFIWRDRARVYLDEVLRANM